MAQNARQWMVDSGAICAARADAQHPLYARAAKIFAECAAATPPREMLEEQMLPHFWRQMLRAARRMA